MAVSVKFGQLEAGLAKLHRIADDKRTQFQARLRKFQRPPICVPKAGTGSRGSSTSYSPMQVMEIALALEFTEYGMGPERMARTLNDQRWNWVQGMGNAAKAFIEARGVTAAYKPVPEGVKPTYMLFDPNNLEELTQREGYGIPRRPMPSGNYDDPEALMAALADMSQFSRFALINVSRVFAGCQSCFIMRDRPAFAAEAYVACREESVQYALKHIADVIQYGLDWTAHWMSAEFPRAYGEEDFLQALATVEVRNPDLTVTEIYKPLADGRKLAEVALSHGRRLWVDWHSEKTDKMEVVLARLDALKAAKESASDTLLPMMWMHGQALSGLDESGELEDLGARAVELGIPILGNNSLHYVTRKLSEAQFMDGAHEYIFTLPDEELMGLSNGDYQKA